MGTTKAITGRDRPSQAAVGSRAVIRSSMSTQTTMTAAMPSRRRHGQAVGVALKVLRRQMLANDLPRPYFDNFLDLTWTSGYLDFRDQAAAWAQARWTAWISSGVGWRGTPG
jgi:hypothetical protein